MLFPSYAIANESEFHGSWSLVESYNSHSNRCTPVTIELRKDGSFTWHACELVTEGDFTIKSINQKTLVTLKTVSNNGEKNCEGAGYPDATTVIGYEFHVQVNNDIASFSRKNDYESKISFRMIKNEKSK